MNRLRRWGRPILRSDWVRRATSYAIHLYIRFVYATNRWIEEGAEHPARLFAEGRPFIGAFWHGRMMMIPMAWARRAPLHMLISPHRDGRIIADAIAHFGVASITGSSRRGGTAALRSLVRLLAAGDHVAITPDGPSGPAMVASSGIVQAARLSRAPIVPIVFATSRRRELDTWDRMYAALPFGRGVFLWGEPVEVEADLDEAGVERVRLQVEQRMLELVAVADSRVGHGTAPPAPAQPPEFERAPELIGGERQ